MPEDCGYIYKKYRLNFKSTQDVFFRMFCNAIYKMVDNMDIYKSLNTSIGTVIKNVEMLKFVTDHLKTNKCVIIQLKNFLVY